MLKRMKKGKIERRRRYMTFSSGAREENEERIT